MLGKGRSLRLKLRRDPSNTARRRSHSHRPRKRTLTHFLHLIATKIVTVTQRGRSLRHLMHHHQRLESPLQQRVVLGISVWERMLMMMMTTTTRVITVKILPTEQLRRAGISPSLQLRRIRMPTKMMDGLELVKRPLLQK